MLLDRIDIDNHGPLTRVELGPFSEHLNVVCTPAGSGKTALARFVRDSLITRDYPIGMMNSSAGRVVWAERNGKIHCRREQDGTNHGRRTIEFESRGDTQLRFDWLHGSWIDGIADSTDASRALESIRIPESVVDGIVTDTAVTSISRVIHACLLNGLDDPKLFAGLPLNHSAISGLSPTPRSASESDQHVLRDELARIESELARLTGARQVRHETRLEVLESHAARQESLRSRLDFLRSLLHHRHLTAGQSIGREWPELRRRLASLRRRRIELTHWIDRLRADRDRVQRSVPVRSYSLVNHLPPAYPVLSASGRLQRELNERTAELDRLSVEIERLERHPAHWGYPLEDLPVASRDAIEAEIRAVSAELETFEPMRSTAYDDSPRVRWLQSRRASLIRQLGVPAPVNRSASPLADEASQWLVRLSGGRLHRIDWNAADFTMSPESISKATRYGMAWVDGRDEAACSATDRALAVLAVRLAAGDLLAATGRAVPLVVEAHHELLQLIPDGVVRGDATLRLSSETTAYPINSAVIAALEDYTKKDRQVVVLASDPGFAHDIARRGGKVFHIHAQRVTHQHRPLWKPHFGNESYAGPHVSTFPINESPAAEEIDPLRRTDAYIDHYDDEFFSYDRGPEATLADINRNLETIWHEAYGDYPRSELDAAGSAYRYRFVEPAYFGDLSARPVVDRSAAAGRAQHLPGHSSPAYQPHAANPHAANPHAVHPHPDQPNWHDGYFYADNYTTRADQPVANTSASQQPNPSRKQASRPASPFYLTVDSPIDQAPSVDAVAASRLRRLNVTHVNHLMDRDPNRLSDALGLAGVTASTIRRWQAECRLVCNVPQLRGFDARILVGCGITDAARLSATNPSDLLDRVEAFLSTERGQRILLSGTSYELSRITSWIATANLGNGDVISIREAPTVDGRVVRQGVKKKPVHAIAQRDGSEYDFIDDFGEVVRARSNRSRKTKVSASASRSVGRDEGATSRQRDTGGKRTRRRSSQSGFETTRRRETRRRTVSSHRPTSVQETETVYQNHGGDEQELRFYLSRESAVVDAPSIGSRMAERLEKIGIHTVDDLLNFDATELAERLNHRRIDADVVTEWQNQAILVCRIPMLRGHDAQLLVAAEITTPEEVASFDPSELLKLIDPIARTNKGKRILRGGNLPDLEEITHWIEYAALNRELIAA